MLKKIIYLSIAILLFSINSKAQTISMIGDGVSGWSTDVNMSTTDNVNYNLSSFTFTTGGAKFRLNADWGTNWGASAFPSGTATLNGSNIPVTAGIYNVSFNRTTGVYSFASAATGFASISINGIAGPGASGDVNMSTVDGINYALDNYTLTNGGLKFRQNQSNTTTWGSASFPSGTATVGGVSIAVTAGTYDIKFNKNTGVYSFNFATISIIGSAASGWSTDVNMTTTDGINYSLDPTVFITGELKFRLNGSWASNWGSNAFPTGTGSLNGNNVPVIAGTYSVTFNRSTGAYTFTSGYPVISLFGNSTDLDLITLDGVNYYANNQTIAVGNYKFRQAHASVINWGAAGFPSGTATLGGSNIPVIGGSYNIKFNKTTGVYSFDYVVISLIGSATPGGWGADTNMTTTDGENYMISGLVLVLGDAKFRQGNDWSTNWGATSFPGGTASPSGANIAVSSASTYTVHFNRLTQVYYFYNEANPNVTTPINICRLSITTPLVAVGPPGYSLKWYTVATLGTASSTAPKPSSSTIGTKTYYVSQVTPGGVEGSRTPIVVNVVAAPGTPLAITAKYNNVLVVANTLGNYVGTSLPVVYSVADVLNAVSYEWTAPSDVNIVSGQGTNTLTVNFLNSAATAGTFVISVKAISEFGCASIARILTGTRAIPATVGIITSSQANVCSVVGTTNNVTYSVVAAPGLSYTWTVPSGATIVGAAIANSIAVSYSNTFVASGTVSVIGVNSLGSSILPRISAVTRRLPATPGLLVGQTYAICPSSEAYNYTFSVPAFANTWTITGPVGSVLKSASNSNNTTNQLISTTDTAFSVTYPTAYVSGSGSISIVASNGCAISAPRTTLIFRNLLTPSSITGPTFIQCEMLSMPVTYSCPVMAFATTYSWTVPVGATILSGQGTNTISVNYPSSFAPTATSGVSVSTSATSCGNTITSSSRKVIITRQVCGLIKVAQTVIYSELYPNPSTDKFNVDIEVTENNTLTIEVFSFNGNLVSAKKHQLEKGKNTINTDIALLPNGLYVVKFTNPSTNVIETKKIFKR